MALLLKSNMMLVAFQTVWCCFHEGTPRSVSGSDMYKSGCSRCLLRRVHETCFAFLSRSGMSFFHEGFSFSKSDRHVMGACCVPCHRSVLVGLCSPSLAHWDLPPVNLCTKLAQRRGQISMVGYYIKRPSQARGSWFITPEQSQLVRG